LEDLLIGGEKLSAEHVNRFQRRKNKVRLTNGYGPTENTTFTTTYRIEKESDNIPIGRPISGTKVYIQNGTNLCGIGIPGELCIAGDGVARGYLNRPELTAEKFIDNPFGEGKLYRSGDLARWLPDGNIEYLGRIDEQVKIRGFRIELGEIESSIRNIEKVKDCAVIAREDKNGEKAIYAYIVSEEEISVTEIRDTLGLTLPEYMIPSYMTQIEKIPVTRNGKLDKRALPEIEGRSEREYIAPRNKEEEAVCAAFSEILGVEKVGVKDNFFELGGHSLRATRLINQIEEKTGTRLPLREVFSHPTPEGLAACLTGGETYIPIPKAEQRDSYPMSSTQKRTYLVTQMDPAGLSYNMPTALKLTGNMDIQKIQESFQALIDRHEGLRTSFGMENGELVQRIAASVRGEVEYEENINADEATIQKRFGEFVRPFDLGTAPLMRIKIVKTAEAEQYVFFDMHHIISDGMSMNIVIEEFSKLYNGEPLEALRVQYKDYSEWMRSRDLSQQAEYWKEQFAEEAPVLDLPTDYPRPQVQSYRGSSETFQLSVEETQALEELCRQTGTTEYMVFLSALMITLSKYSRQEDIVIGSPISGRTHRDTETMLGMFVNTLAMRGRPEGKKTLREFLNEVKETCLKAYENQEYPFEELVEAVEVRRDISRNPLFDVMMVVQNNEDVPLKLNGVELTGGLLTSEVSKFDLDFNISKVGEEYYIRTSYCIDLFKAESIQWLNLHYKEMIHRMSENLDTKLEEISAADAEEYEKIVKEFNDTAADYPKDKTVIDLFEEQVEKTPDNIAVVFEDTQLTYAELNDKANQLAWEMKACGIQAADYVAIITQRSVEAVIGICAILKTGAAYVPIDKSYPKQRIQEILQDCTAKALLVYGVEIDTDIHTIEIADEKLRNNSTDNPPKVNEAKDLAYCIYTSGTTGKPKGVMVEHRNIVKLVINCDYVTLNEESRILQTGQLAFDASTFEIWGALLHGGSVHLIKEELLLQIEEFKRYLINNGINTLFITTALFNQYIKTDRTIFNTLKYLMFGGERTQEECVKLFQAEKNGVEFSNVYGPTETTTFAMQYKIVEEREKTPIGKAISNTQVYIMQGKQLCGIGMPGELCIAGGGVSRGYLNRPELTAEKFIDNPYGEGKLYRSGDLARWLPDGNIEKDAFFHGMFSVCPTF
jgi:amino acid adenylation domain-containing protein